MRDINGTEVQVGDTVEIVKPEEPFHTAGDRAEIIQVDEYTCFGDFTQNKNYRADGKWKIGKSLDGTTSTCKIITHIDDYETKPIDYDGCHPIIAEALCGGRIIKCMVGDGGTSNRPDWVSGYLKQTTSSLRYIDVDRCGWENAEPIKKADKYVKKGDKGWMSKENFNQARDKWVRIVGVVEGRYTWAYYGGVLSGRDGENTIDIEVADACGFCKTFDCKTCPLSPSYCGPTDGSATFSKAVNAMKCGDLAEALDHAKRMVGAIEAHGKKLGYIDV